MVLLKGLLLLMTFASVLGIFIIFHPWFCLSLLDPKLAIVVAAFNHRISEVHKALWPSQVLHLCQCQQHSLRGLIHVHGIIMQKWKPLEDIFFKTLIFSADVMQSHVHWVPFVESIVSLQVRVLINSAPVADWCSAKFQSTLDNEVIHLLSFRCRNHNYGICSRTPSLQGPHNIPYSTTHVQWTSQWVSHIF